MAEAKPKRKINFSNVREEARALIWEHRRVLAIGLVLMLINRLSGLVTPYMPKLLGDYVITPHRPDRLVQLALIAAVATILQVASSFALAKIVSIAGQRAIATMRET